MNDIVKPASMQVLDTRYTQDVIPTLDTSKFEHMQRIAMMMARSSVIPESLRKGKDENAKEIWLDHEVVVANCFRIVNQAVRWGMDPFAVADCASIVHGRLMWEGKLIAAVLDSKLGVNLEYTFTDEDKPADSQKLGVVVSGKLPDETKIRTIEGTVAAWHKGSKSPWANPAAWKRQLRYMGAREWARAHKPSVMLGIYTDDEFDNLMQRDVPSGKRAVRMKDVTPPITKSPVLEIPDVPPTVSAEPTVAASTDGVLLPPDPDDANALADESGLLETLQKAYSACDSEGDVDQVRETYGDLIERLSPANRREAEKILGGDS